MSVNASLVCYECQNELHLGQRSPKPYAEPVTHYVDSGPESVVWRNPRGCMVLHRFLANHVGHRLAAVLEEGDIGKRSLDDYHWHSHPDSYTEIGGETALDISFEDYLKGFDETVRPDPKNWEGWPAGREPERERYAYLICVENHDRICLGTPYRARGRIQHFYVAGQHRLSADLPRMQAIFKFLADNTGEVLRVVLEDELMSIVGHPRGREIGGEAPGDISFEEYLAGWPGL